MSLTYSYFLLLLLVLNIFINRSHKWVLCLLFVFYWIISEMRNKNQTKLWKTQATLQNDSKSSSASLKRRWDTGFQEFPATVWKQALHWAPRISALEQCWHAGDCPGKTHKLSVSLIGHQWLWKIEFHIHHSGGQHKSLDRISA